MKCEKCKGSGWVYGFELEEADENTRNDDMTKYLCDICTNANAEEPYNYVPELYKYGGIIASDETDSAIQSSVKVMAKMANDLEDLGVCNDMVREIAVDRGYELGRAV